VIIKRAPAWSGWTTVMVGFITSLAAKIFLTPAWLERAMGWPANSLSAREADDWVLLLGVLLNTVVCSAWFLGTCWFAKSRSAQEVAQTEKFFEQMRTPVDFQKEEGANNDAQQYRTLGLMCLIYGAFISLLVLIPNSPAGRLGMFACAGTMLGIGGLLFWNYKRLQSKTPQK
jgi:formate hydrogenlyase subunit 3/multisubunit Na+/H+ antiporter MnhD subunit